MPNDICYPELKDVEIDENSRSDEENSRSEREMSESEIIDINASQGWIRCTDENYPGNSYEISVAYWNGYNWDYWIYGYCPYGWNVLCRSEAYWRKINEPIRNKED